MLPASFHTPRLTLRMPVFADSFKIYESYTRDPAVSRYCVWKPHQDISEANVFIAQCIADYTEGHRMPYVVTLRENSDIPIGMLDVVIDKFKAEVGYILAQEYWGRGYMTEALSDLSDKVLNTDRFYRMQAYIDTDNTASRRVLEKSGFCMEGRLERYSIHPNISSEPRAVFMYAKWK